MPTLDRRLETADAVVIGLSSMLGAGVFVVLGPATAAARGGVLVSLVVAALVAWANATSTAQLAAVLPRAGGVYAYGRERLGEWPGFLAGLAFVLGKTASCAVMAGTVAAYVVPTAWHRPVAALVVVALVAVNLAGVSRTAAAARLLLAVAVVVLVAVVVVALGRHVDTLPGDVLPHGLPGGVRGTLQGAALLFFAFAGYARVATLGEEVRKPRTTIPRAIRLALALVAVGYLAVAVAVLHVLGVDGAAGSRAPVLDTATATAGWLVPAVRVAAVAAAGGALLALLAGVSRTAFAMAREGDLPRRWAAVGGRSRAPWLAELVVGATVVVLTLAVDLTGVLVVSSFGVLLYYGIGHAAAWTQPAADRIAPRWVPAVGLVGCLALATALPGWAVAAGVGVLAVGSAVRAVAVRVRRSAAGRPSRSGGDGGGGGPTR
ncbi:putative transporter [Cellulomonas sp. T2.31MG-18]|uniref:APC family permease n=1 Tax=Cellulomonas sp. T2.31MG-18 TaxID=3157619 RepID=UPI0035ECF3B2